MGQFQFTLFLQDKAIALYSATDGDAVDGKRTANNSTSDEEMSDNDDDDFGDDIDEDEDEELKDILDNDLNWELEISRRKKRWRAKVEEMRAAKKQKGKAKSSDPLRKSSSSANKNGKQVFTAAGAEGILTNDLVSIMKASGDTGIDADTIDDNIFRWSVKLRGFDPMSPLSEDLAELKNVYGYGHIELQLDFLMDLHPFFPPFVKVIRPILNDSMMLRITTMGMLKLSNWNPTRDMKAILWDIREFLQTSARVNIESERNDPVLYPEGAYMNLEYRLIHLALVAEVRKSYTS